MTQYTPYMYVCVKQFTFEGFFAPDAPVTGVLSLYNGLALSAVH